MMHEPHRHRPGFTLVELVLSMAVMTILMGGLTSAILLASRAMPDPQDPLAHVVEAAQVADHIAGELYCAQFFTERTATAIQFTVADRNADAVPETIRYAWSGTAGDPLTRQYNGGTIVNVAENVHEFQLVYKLDVVGVVYLTGVRISLRVGSDASARVDTSVQILNAPEVTGP